MLFKGLVAKAEPSKLLFHQFSCLSLSNEIAQLGAEMDEKLLEGNQFSS